MSLAGRAARFIAGELTKAALSAAGTQIGEAIGKRIGARIYTPPPEAGKSGDDVTLVVNGKRYGGWKSVRITRTIEALADSFALDGKVAGVDRSEA